MKNIWYCCDKPLVVVVPASGPGCDWRLVWLGWAVIGGGRGSEDRGC